MKNLSIKCYTEGTFLKAALAHMCVEKQIFTNIDTGDRQNGSQLFVTLWSTAKNEFFVI